MTDQLQMEREQIRIETEEKIKQYYKQEIDRLNNQVKWDYEQINRLRNIINKLEKWLEEEIIEGNKRPEDYEKYGIEDYVKGQVVAFKHVLDKLKALKEDNNV